MSKGFKRNVSQKAGGLGGWLGIPMNSGLVKKCLINSDVGQRLVREPRCMCTLPIIYEISVCLNGCRISILSRPSKTAQPQSFKLVVPVTADTAPVFNSVALMAPNCGDDVDDILSGVVIPTKAPEVPGHPWWM